MLDKLRKNWRLMREQLLSTNEATGAASAYLLSALQSGNANPASAPQYVQAMLKDFNWTKYWGERYFPKLQMAISRPTKADQAKGLRSLSLTCMDSIAEASWILFERMAPPSKRSDSELVLLCDFMLPGMNLDDFVALQAGRLTEYEASLAATIALGLRYFGDNPVNYANAYRFMTGVFAGLRVDRIIEDKKSGSISCLSNYAPTPILNAAEFTARELTRIAANSSSPNDRSSQRRFDRLREMLPTIAAQIVDGRNVALDGELRELFGD